MNSIEQEHINNQFQTNPENKTMQDYFNSIMTYVSGAITEEELKLEFKNRYPDVTDWSF
tara:strand:+ start:11652 stop:11828 length:177 start_codon:yes stop_codon:yes gene_type:complete